MPGQDHALQPPLTGVHGAELEIPPPEGGEGAGGGLTPPPAAPAGAGVGGGAGAGSGAGTVGGFAAEATVVGVFTTPPGETAFRAAAKPKPELPA